MSESDREIWPLAEIRLPLLATVFRFLSFFYAVFRIKWPLGKKKKRGVILELSTKISRQCLREDVHKYALTKGSILDVGDCMTVGASETNDAMTRRLMKSNICVH